MNLISKDISADFPKSDKTYLNNASVSLMSSQSIDAMKEFLVSYNLIGLVCFSDYCNDSAIFNDGCCRS